MALLDNKLGRRVQLRLGLAPWMQTFPWLLMRIGSAGDGRARGSLSVWLWYEQMCYRVWKVKDIRPGGIMGYSISSYKGPPRILKDGTELREGDRMVELHVNNRYTSQMFSGDRILLWRGMKIVYDDLITVMLNTRDGCYGDARAIHGISLLSHIGTRVHAEIEDIPHNFWSDVVRYFMVGLIIVHHPDGWKRAGHLRGDLWPGEVFIGIEAIRAWDWDAEPLPPDRPNLDELPERESPHSRPLSHKGRGGRT